MKPFFQCLLFSCLLLQACSNNAKPLTQHSQPDTLLPPYIIPMDSLKPTITLLDTAPKPTVLAFTLPGSSSDKHNGQAKPETIKSTRAETNAVAMLNDEKSKRSIRGKSRFTNFTMADGLGLATIQCATLDHYGNLWFGHDGAGATRYDGKTFTTFTKAQGLASNYVYGITEDKSGNLLFITGGAYISRFDGKRFTQFGKTIPTLPGDFASFRSIIHDKSGDLWFASGAGVSRFDGKSFTFYTTADGLADNNVSAICEDRTGKIWFATHGGGINCYDGKKFATFTTTHGLISNDVVCITEDKSGNLWFGTPGYGVSCYDGKKFTTFTTAQGLISNDVTCITEDKSGNLWFGTYANGASRFDGKSFTSFTTAEGLSSNVIYSITADNSGSIWFGTYGAGICRYDGDAFTIISMAQGLSYNSIVSITEGRSGKMWFGTSGGGINYYDGIKFTKVYSGKWLADDFVRAIRSDRAGNIWIAGASSGNGLVKYDGSNLTFYNRQQGLTDDFVWSVLVDKDQNIWAGNTGGISKLDGKSVTSFNYDGIVDEIVQDRSGNIWFGYFGLGLLKYDGKSFTAFSRAQGLPDEDVRCIAEDKNGNLWIGTGAGLSRFDGKRFENITTTDGLDDNNVYDIVFDKEDNMYISTNIGITVLSASVTSLPVAKLREGMQHFSIEQGYPVSAVWRNSMYCDSKGIVWIGSSNENAPLIRFDPSALPKYDNLPLSLVIQQIKIDEQNICWSDLSTGTESISRQQGENSIIMPANITEENLTFRRTLSDEERERMRKQFGDIGFDSISSFYLLPLNLRLPQAHNNITIDFNATEVAYPNLVNYQYILEGYSKDWSPVTKSTTASFGNMHEGKYTFKVKAMGPNGVWSAPVTYTFNVLPPWWRTWWAYSIYVLIFLAALRVFSKWRERKLRSEKEKLEVKVERRTQQLNESIETLKSTQSQLIQSEKMASLGELTAGIAHEIQNPLNFVNNFSEVNKELVDELQQELKAGKIDEAIAVSNDIKDNEEKINHHGKRADAIVKGMLQHSRSGSGQKEATGINVLADEYLRLAYHGLRGKDNSFNVTMKTDFDETLSADEAGIGKINIIPQDIGRVLLNLYNNAFYAVNEKSKSQNEKYEPTVFVSTKKEGNKVLISVKDNGNGIPQNIVVKIFQPFFTTKPTGQGTGLGLSLSYDIVKAHGGEIKVETKEVEGTEFIIQLPIV